ncbi:MAG TPA: hypothetical protein VLO07_02045 [Thermoanaerobaculia bacterium]|nr:hypothetical protein [Thermoanaerobaculia bacterium]
MRGINWGRVFLGGIVAGIVVNISEFLLNTVVLKNDWDAAMKALNKSMQMTGGATTVWIVFGFLVGIASVWLYAAIRPRYGAGPGTAVKAGFAAWFFINLLSTIAQMNLDLFPSRILAVSCIWALVEMIIATLVGAWLYKEEGA